MRHFEAQLLDTTRTLTNSNKRTKGLLLMRTPLHPLKPLRPLFLNNNLSNNSNSSLTPCLLDTTPTTCRLLTSSMHITRTSTRPKPQGSPPDTPHMAGSTLERMCTLHMVKPLVVLLLRLQPRELRFLKERPVSLPLPNPRLGPHLVELVATPSPMPRPQCTACPDTMTLH